MFIVTTGGENYKLGLVPIALYSLDSFKPYLEQKKQQAQTEFARLGLSVDAAKSEMGAKRRTQDATLAAYAKDLNANRGSFEAAYNQAKEQWKVVMQLFWSGLADNRDEYPIHADRVA